MIKNPPSEISPDFIKAFQLCQQKMFEKSTILLSLAAQQEDPCACITVASNCLTNITLESFATSMFFLTKALKYGLDKNKFCNEKFLHELCMYIQTVITIPNPPYQCKEHLLSVIKNELIKHEVDLDCFCTIVQNIVKINLSECLEWVIGAIKEKKIEQMSFAELLENIIKNPEDPLSPDYLAYCQASVNGSLAKTIELSQILREAKNPTVFINTASGLLVLDWQKNYESSKEYLSDGINYGCVDHKFCNRACLIALLSYMNNIKQCITSLPKRTELTSVVIDTLKKNNMNIGIFDQLLKKYVENPSLFS